MPRPRKCRMVDSQPNVTFFKPRGIPMRELMERYLPLEGYEALRLVEVEGLKHEEAAKRMNISRQTFGRILSQARRIVAEVIVHGLALRVEGGDYAIINEPNIHEKPAEKEKNMNKVAVSSEGPTLDSSVDPRFGRAAGFMIVDSETMAFEYIDNGASQAMAQGAGIQAAERVAASDAGVVLTGYVGPKAYQALAAAGIKVVQNLNNMTIQQAVERFKGGDIEFASAPNKGGHWS
ncbi:MAG: DUF134 domain-containing protein [Deltaproteobacteria bacterium]|nr:DUF134 domain-containing protein [Deltaproteobacteria bacterium]